MQTLEIVRATIFESYQAGLDKQDRQLGEKLMNSLIFQARATLIDQKFSDTGQIDPEWLQTIPLVVTKTNDSTNGYEYSTTLPDIIMLEDDAGFYRLRSITNNTQKIITFERVTSSMGGLSKYDRITGHRTKVSRIGSKLELRTRTTLPKNILADVILYDPFDQSGWTDQSLFPFSETLTEQLKETIYGMDLKVIFGNKDDKNDSKEAITGPQAPAGQ